MNDVLKSFLIKRGHIEEDNPKTKQTKKEMNVEYVNNTCNFSMINKIIEEKPKEKYLIKYFKERLKEMDEQIIED
jgi:hypothetical protein